MRFVTYPNRKQWKSLCKRPVSNSKEINKLVKPILKSVKSQGDQALKDFTFKFDKVSIENLQVTDKEIKQSSLLVPNELKKAIEIAFNNITKFHEQQIQSEEKIETTEGVFCWRKSIGIEKVGLYIPGGTAPLFSTVLMLAIPAKLAGCKEVVLCSPPNIDGNIHPAILYAANLSGVHKIFKVGGAQAIAAMAYGTETIPKTYKIFGPGNQFVTAAKQLVSNSGTSIDMPAGPSEVLVIADESANPVFVASDLIAQAEHGNDSQSILVTDSLKLAEEVLKEVDIQLETLPRKEIASTSLSNSTIILLKNFDIIFEFSNLYAPEHLIISTNDSHKFLNKVVNAGSVFVGHYTPESLGDYASGTNHTLPTNGFANVFSGVSVDSFVKKITFQEATPNGLQKLGPIVETLAENEQLIGHKRAVTNRLNALGKAD